MAIAFAREGADVAIAHLAGGAGRRRRHRRLIERGRPAGLSIAGDLRDEDFAAAIVDGRVEEFGGLDILVLNAGYQKDREGLETLATERFDRVFRTNLYGMIVHRARRRSRT